MPRKSKFSASQISSLVLVAPTRGGSNASGRSPIINSLRSCTFSGIMIHKEDLKKKIMMPEYLRLAMKEAIQTKDVEAGTVTQLCEKAHARLIFQSRRWLFLLTPRAVGVMGLNSRPNFRNSWPKNSWHVLISVPDVGRLGHTLFSQATKETPLDQEWMLKLLMDTVACKAGSTRHVPAFQGTEEYPKDIHQEGQLVGMGANPSPLKCEGYSCSRYSWLLKWKKSWDHPKPEYLEKIGFVEVHADDGYLEIFGLKQGWHASIIMVDLISVKHIAQCLAISFELIGGAWKKACMQMDGRPCQQLLNELSTFIEVKRVPFRSVMVDGL
ncbi:diacylglycerol kinase 7-like [Olea europaea subsp. europaea]|uniref:Diacylglycerol kinase 7-like n=1 Tax=Olea europaea subsp. europaea TaxID=158383 RepID=A0A8S0SSG4_OLEEU|nr:diacylglycerol kinase 7-like [Olea europaea subsp. europaea]